MELKRVDFATERKGYSTSQVDDYISYVLSKYQELEKEHAELEKKYRAAQIKLEEAKSEESAISTIIVSAQKMADSIIKDAKEKARTISAALEESCDEILAAYSAKAKEERAKLRDAERSVAAFKDSLYKAYKEHLDAIELIMPDEETDGGLSDKTDDELDSEALELAEKKYKEADTDEIEIISKSNSANED